ncbi:hypothetical protein QIS99_28750 [Streptomyces sp. B-S-A8]|uniref:Uncharacterized protein n=1 Tax=Streptomyces solicavernae TaxID=3043614 RepID=A0ABT6S0P2_9ACTN|nr:hypothetical protein [Streptomyces sp. B-S-A8]MDI3390150.1 hypothetical protein [Streptomyces sp. B-S-A8]
MTLRARDARTRQVIVLTDDPSSADALPEGTLDNGRYQCLSCHKPMSLSRRRGPTSTYRPRFAHGSRKADDLQVVDAEDLCGARAEVRERVDQEVEVIIDLRDHLVRAWPGTPTRIECPQPPDDGAPVPPVVVAKDGDQMLVIERQRGELTEESVRRRVAAVRHTYGTGARHVWFFAENLTHFRQGGLRDKSVRPAGETESVRHRRVRPTEQQLQIVDAGGAVYWVDGDNVLVPYGGHEFQHEPRRGEEFDWAGIEWRRTDWRISHPVPAPGAQWWGLVEIGLSTLRVGKLGFHPSEAHDVMERLERVQAARWNSSKRAAREQARAKQEQLKAEAARPSTPAAETVKPPAPTPLPAAPPSPADPAAPTPRPQPEAAEEDASTAAPHDDEGTLGPVVPPKPSVPPPVPPAVPAPGPEQRPRSWREVLRPLFQRRKRG